MFLFSLLVLAGAPLVRIHPVAAVGKDMCDKLGYGIPAALLLPFLILPSWHRSTGFSSSSASSTAAATSFATTHDRHTSQRVQGLQLLNSAPARPRDIMLSCGAIATQKP